MIEKISYHGDDYILCILQADTSRCSVVRQVRAAYSARTLHGNLPRSTGVDRQYGPTWECGSARGTRYKQIAPENVPMRTSTAVIALGVVLFVIPLPGTFILGGAVALFGVLLRLFGV
jgi:hypothetical protein